MEIEVDIHGYHAIVEWDSAYTNVSPQTTSVMP